MISSQTLNDLRRDEGWSSKPYRDSLGYLTIGYGFLIDERKPVTIPRAVGELWLQLGAESAWSELLSMYPWLKDQPDEVKQALQNMAYTMGAVGVSGFTLMLAALQRGDRITAAINCLHSKWHDEAPLRCERVANLIRGYLHESDDYP